MSASRLSKSRYLSGLQCPKRVYLEVHAPDLASELDEGTQAVLDAGTRVGALARECYPGGARLEVQYFKVGEGLARTAGLLRASSVPAIYEGFLTFDDVLVRPDILVRTRGDRWRLIEVKSTSRVKDEHLDDLAIQEYVLRGAGLALDATSLMHVNSEYLYPGGPLDLSQLFLEEDLTEAVADRQAEVPARLTEMRQTLGASTPPAVEPDDHCFAPYECPFWAHCTEGKPARWIFHLPGRRQAYADLLARGVQTIDEIPAGYPLQPIQQRVKDNVEWIGPRLRAALAAVKYPVHHLDFETISSAIPLYPNTRPYQSIPFQWSNHIEGADGAVRHEAYLCPDARDPRQELTVALLRSVGQQGSICTYTGYERTVLTGLAEALPEFRPDIQALGDRLWDLHPIVKAHYYHPAFAGSYSIKAVLPAVAPHLAYGDLEIQEGSMASVQFYRMAFEEMDPVEKALAKTEP
jgi:predicted RecB family nuclease